MLVAGAVGLMWPLIGTLLGQPEKVGTAVFGGVYFWSVLTMWLGLLLKRLGRASVQLLFTRGADPRIRRLARAAMNEIVSIAKGSANNPLR